MATIGTKSQRKEPKTEISWKGKMDQTNLTKTIEHITTTGNNQQGKGENYLNRKTNYYHRPKRFVYGISNGGGYYG